MERSNQPSEPECCRGEGQAFAAKAGGGAEQLLGSVHREIRGPQARVAPRLSNSASKPSDAGGDVVLSTEPKTNSAGDGEALAGLPGSKSVAREEQTVRNLGGPVAPAALIARAKRVGLLNDKKGRPKVNWESDRFIVAQGNPCKMGPTWVKGATIQCGLHRQPAPVRLTGDHWQTFLRAIKWRVELKSPVREYCTPGSVRGAPGNRRPYCSAARKSLK